MHIALTGFMGSGKGELAKRLQEKGFRYISLSDIVRKIATEKGLEHTRENLQSVGNSLREEFGPGVLGLKIRETIEKENGDEEKIHWVIDGIRHPHEAQEIKKLPDSHLLGVTADFDTLIERLFTRQRDSEASLSKEEISEKLKKESGIGESNNGQQVQKCLDICNYLIFNEGTLEELENKLEHFIKLSQNIERPSFDEIFMEIAYSWSKRATCLRRKVGAVIAKDSQQLTAGYNGAPRGIPHCAEVGCVREKFGVPSGQKAELCRGTHAEQNAITQAAKFGINIEGATLYCNTFPCVICTKMILNSGITKVVYDSDYNDPLSKEILGQQDRVKMIRYEGKMCR